MYIIMSRTNSNSSPRVLPCRTSALLHCYTTAAVLILIIVQSASSSNSISNSSNKNNSFVFGSPCQDHSDCSNSLGISSSSRHGTSPPVCARGTCQCPPYHLRVGGALCLPGRLLGFKCHSDSQCRVRVPMSGCVQGVCQCGDGYTPYRRANCLKASRVGGGCRSQGQCRSHSPHSYCNYAVPRVFGHCACTPEYSPTEGGSCQPRHLGLGSSCTSSRQCSLRVRGALCVLPQDNNMTPHSSNSNNIHTDYPLHTRGNTDYVSHNRITDIGSHTADSGGVCVCPKGHASTDSKCIPIGKEIGERALSLGQRCARSSQCQAADPHSHCSNAGLCDCVKRTHSCSTTNTGCHRNTFQCVSDGVCLSSHYVCDGVPHCRDHSDEAECQGRRCSQYSFRCPSGRCITRGALCDGRRDCEDGADEDACQGDCPKSTFRCGDGRCLPGYVFCNAQATCTDGSDEDHRACVLGAPRLRYCPFRCNNGRCRSLSVLCSGTDGCGDNSDEEKCAVCACPAL